MPYKNPRSDIAIQGQKKRSKKHYNKLKDDIEFKRRRKYTQWKHFGIKGDYNEIFELYMNTSECFDCGKIFPRENVRGRNCKCADHDHLSGYFRNIICNECNNKRGKVDRQKMMLLLDIHRYHHRK